MTLITLKLSAKELDLLTALAADQLFRREFIDPKLPGNKSDPADVGLGKKLIERLRMTADKAKGKQRPASAAGARSPKRNGATNAV